jgi:hypothetical protein
MRSRRCTLRDMSLVKACQGLGLACEPLDGLRMACSSKQRGLDAQQQLLLYGHQ